MPSILFPILAVSLLIPFSSCACDPENRENVCLVPSSCIVGNTLPKYQFVEFNSARDTIDNNYCTMIFMLKNINGKQWLLQYQSTITNAAYHFMIGGLGLHCEYLGKEGKVIAYNETETLIYQEESHVNFQKDILHCQSIIHASGNKKLHSLLQKTIIKFRVATAEVKFALTDEFLLRVEKTKSCDPALIDVKTGSSHEGELLDVMTILSGEGASIDCKHKRADRLYIKRASDPEFIEVNEVSCPKEVWAITYINQTVQKLGTEEFALKCVRNYCKFCGKISELTCDECTPIEYDDCQPQCKSQLWVRKNRIIKSNITCKPLDGNKEADSGLWYLVSNGVDTPFEEGSCYNGTYPLLAEVKAISDSSPSFSQRAILLVLLIAFI